MNIPMTNEIQNPVSGNKLILIADPEILAIPIKENHDPLIDLKDQSIIILGPSPEIPNNTDYTKMRLSVYKKLVEAQTMLPQGLKFCLYEGLRNLVLQEKLFNDRYCLLKKKNPSWSHTEIFIESTKFVSPVINLDGSQNIPPHSTGAAIDVYLLDDKNQRINMGMGVDDSIQDIDGALSMTDSTCITEEAKKNRRIMGDVLRAVGFVNYPTEFWHWSYGDRYWAYHKQEPYALYGSISSFPSTEF